MTVWVVRRSLEGNAIEGPRLCARPGRIVREPGLLALEELFATFLSEGESVHELCKERRWKIVQEERSVGFFEVVDGPSEVSPSSSGAT